MDIETESVEVNKMIYDYLLERGLNHSAFVFSKETEIDKDSKTNFNDLLTLINKGKIYEEMEKDLEKEIINDLQIEENEKINDFIEKKIEEKILTFVEKEKGENNKNDIFKESELNGKGHFSFSYQLYKNKLFGIDKKNQVFVLIDLTDSNKSRDIKKIDKNFTKNYDVLFCDYLILFNKKEIHFFDIEIFSLKKSYILQNENELNEILSFGNFYLLLTTKNTVLLNNIFFVEFCLKKKFSNATKSKNSIYFLSNLENKIYCYSFVKKQFFELIIPNDVNLLTIGTNSDSKILTVFCFDSKLNKNLVFIYVEGLIENVFSFYLKEFLGKIKIYEDQKILFYGEKSLCIFNLEKMNLIFKKKIPNVFIINVEWISSNEIIIEFLGNTFKKINIIDQSYFDFDRTGKEYYMLLNISQNQIIEIENIENYNVIKI